MLKKWKPSWPQVAILGLVLAAFIASYFLPEGVREELRSDIGWIWGALSMLAGPLVRRKLQSELDAEASK